MVKQGSACKQNIGTGKMHFVFAKCSYEQFDDGVERLGSAGMQPNCKSVDDALSIKSGQVFLESFAQKISFDTFKHAFVETGERVVFFLEL